MPKFHLDTGERNEVHVVGLNHKMGYTGTVNTVLEFGEERDCIGYMIGGPNEGLRIMFSMMNEARELVSASVRLLSDMRDLDIP